MNNGKLTWQRVEGRRMMLGITKAAIARATGHYRSHVTRVLRGDATSAPLLKAAWTYMDEIEAEAAAEAATETR